MLIALQTKSVEELSKNVFRLNFTIPPITLDEHKYTIALRTMIIDLKDTPPDLIISLNTTIIDRTALNPRQQLYSTVTITGSNYILCEPTLSRKYKIQTPNLNDSEFILRVREGNFIPKLVLNQVDLILEVERDARFQ